MFDCLYDMGGQSGEAGIRDVVTSFAADSSKDLSFVETPTCGVLAPDAGPD